MPTIRSNFSFEQFKEVLQKIAHEIALDAVKNLNKGRVRIIINGSRLSEVSVGNGSLVIKFYAHHASYWHQPDGTYKEWWGFDVEEKFYLTSNHCCKISFVEGSDTSATAAKKKKIEAFIEKLMTEAGIKPVPRFRLSNHVKE